ncbi:HlyC/CorC family transporter [candidate division WOR-3 bacterium]|nr:HlyC/CorC family transporter [candidate division WOR-3 bacterium]
MINLFNKLFKKNRQIIKTEKDIKDILTISEKAGIITADETELIKSVFDVGDTPVFEVMTPRVDIIAVKYNIKIETLIDVIIKNTHSKLPIYIKNIDDLLGVIYATDILKIWGTERYIYACDIVRQPYYIPRYKTVLSTLREFQANKISIAFVVDEYGGISGLVTLEDLIEEIVGELKDEFDREELLYKKLKDGTYIIDGKIELEDFNKIFKTEYIEEDYHTLGGLIYHKLERIPQNGEVVNIPPIKFKIVKMQDQRIKHIQIFNYEE